MRVSLLISGSDSCMSGALVGACLSSALVGACLSSSLVGACLSGALVGAYLSGAFLGACMSVAWVVQPLVHVNYWTIASKDLLGAEQIQVC